MQISRAHALLLSLMLSIVGVIAVAPNASAVGTGCPSGPTRFYNSVSWYDWSPRSYGPGGICIQNSRGIVIFQGDGNLVEYDYGRPVWASGTNGRVGNGQLAFQSDGNLVIYSESGVPVWSTGTYDPNPGNMKNRMLAYQASDGNLVIYGNVPGRDGRYPLWAR